MRAALAAANAHDEGAHEALRERLRDRLPRGPDGEILLAARAWAVKGQFAGQACSFRLVAPAMIGIISLIMLDSPFKQHRYDRLLSLLQPQHRRFVEEYLKDFIGPAAVIRAGYSAKTARQQATRLLGRLRIREAIDAGMQLQDRWAEDITQRLRDRLAAIAAVEYTDLFDENHEPLPPEKWPAGAAHAIQSITIQSGPGKDDPCTLARLRRVNKVNTLALLLDVISALDGKPQDHDIPVIATDSGYRFWDEVVRVLLDRGFLLWRPTGGQVVRYTLEKELNALAPAGPDDADK